MAPGGALLTAPTNVWALTEPRAHGLGCPEEDLISVLDRLE